MSKTRFILASLSLLIALQSCQAQPAKTPSATATAPAASVAPAAPAPVTDISADDYLKMKAENPALQLLDVRTPEEVAEGFIEGSHKVNVHDEAFTEKVAQVTNKSVPLVVYCKSGGRSARAADLLTKAGFEKVYNLTGGITSWLAQGKPTVQ